MNSPDESRSGCDDSSICLTCGACCGYFRVSFYWAEADDSDSGITPAALTEPVSPFLRCMRGTNNAAHCRCCALTGEIGQTVSCGIYHLRPSTCREFQRYGEAGSVNEACNRARERYGLSPLPIAR